MQHTWDTTGKFPGNAAHLPMCHFWDLERCCVTIPNRDVEEATPQTSHSGNDCEACAGPVKKYIQGVRGF